MEFSTAQLAIVPN